MIRSQDGLLLAVTFSSIFLGVAFPNICSFFAGLPMYAMMALLFLGFLPIRLSDLMNGLKSEPIRICFFLFLKLVCLPILVYLVFINIAPEFALAALLLSGISTGVVAPFFADMLDADVPKVILVVVISSILVPFTLPLLVKILIGHQMAISLSKMIQLLGTVIFIPLMGVEILRRVKPQWIDTMLKVKQPTSLFLFAVTNMGVFSNYAFFFRKQMATVFVSCGVAFILAGLYLGAGLVASWRRPIKEKLTTIIMFGIMNNILVIVFSAEFFGPLEPTVAAAYCIPFFGLILPLRILQTMG